MPEIIVPRIEATTLLKAMSSGRTKPCLVMAADDDGGSHEVVVKWRAAKEMGERAVICELMTSLLAADLGIPAPKPFIVDVSAAFFLGDGKFDLAAIARRSAGLNFGSEKLPPGFATWPKDKPIPTLLRPLAAEIFAFDVLIQILIDGATTPIFYGAETRSLSAITNKPFPSSWASSVGNHPGPITGAHSSVSMYFFSH